MVELIVNEKRIELKKDASIKYTKQIADIYDLANVSCSFTNSFEFEKTPENSRTMQQLGISGDYSPVPYQKNTAQLKLDGFDLISQGWFNLSATDDNYKGSVINGMIDFFKAIENKTIGKDLDLTNFNHEKILQTVVDSFTNDYYQYIVADYGGKNIFDSGINIDYLTPCFSVRKIWELIFSTFNFNCDYTNLGYLDGLYITYPKDIFEDQTNDLIADLSKSPFKTNKFNTIGGFGYLKNNKSWDTVAITEGSLIDNWKYVIPETNSYNFFLSIEMYAKYPRSNYYTRNIDVSVSILKNGVIVGSILSDYKESPTTGDERQLEFNISCDAGDIIEVSVYAPVRLTFRGKYFYLNEFRTNSLNLKIYQTDLGTTVLENEFKDFQIKDFIKEIIWRTGLTPIYDTYTNTVSFNTLDSRVDFENAQDLSHTFIKRTNEAYTSELAQKNSFKLKRDSDTDFTGDGYLYVLNKNIEDEKTLAQSKIYAPDKKILTTFFGFSTNQYKIWNIEIKDNADNVEITYKGLSGRFYFIRKTNITGSFKLVSEKLIDDTTVAEIPIGINTNTLFEEAIFNNYAEYQRIFNNFRIHNIDMAMNINDFIGLDLTRPVFFRQENAYYICNKVSYEEGENSNGEFIKINKI